MDGFKFQASTKVIFDLDMVQNLGAEVKALNVRKVLAVTVVQAIQTFIRSLNNSDNLQTLGVQKKDFEKQADICLLDVSTPRNPLPITAKDFLNIYERMYQTVA